MRAPAAALVVLLIAVTCQAAASASSCTAGDAACFCEQIGGTYVALSEPLGPPACRVPFRHQGQGRYVHIYLPPSYDGVTQFPVWVHLHGVFWTTMGDIGQLVGKAVNGTDVIPKWDKTVGLFGDQAIIVYPQSLGDPGTGDEAVDGQGDKYRQFWSIPFWQCSAGICRPKELDDAGFIEAVIADLPKRLPMVPGKTLLSGVSAGGMMVQTLLCQSPAVGSAITAAVDMLGGIASDYALGPQCAASSAVPFLKLQGTDDPTITFAKQILVDGVNFLSAIEATQQRAKHNGCGARDAGPQTSEADGQMQCTDYCGKAAGKPAAKMCGMLGVGHTTDFPHPGFVFEQAWQFFEQQAKLAAAKKPTVVVAAADAALDVTVEKSAAAAEATVPAAQPAAKPAVAVTAAARAQAKSVAAAAGHAKGPLQLTVFFPGVMLAAFKGGMASKSVAAVAAASGLPASNISATYTEAKSAGRRMLATHEPSSSSSTSAGVAAMYSLSAARPAAVAQQLVTAVNDGSLQQELQARLDLPSSPVVSLSATASESGTEPEVLLKPASLDAAAAAADGAAAVIAAVAGSVEAIAAASRSAAAAEDVSAAAAASSSSSRTDAIVGGVVGGICGAAVVAGVAWWCTVGAKKRQQQQQQQSNLPKDVLAPSTSGSSWNGDDASSMISGSTSTGNLKSVDIVMHVIEEDAASAKGGKAFAA